MELLKKIFSKYLVFDSTDENKEVLKNYTELWDEIRSETETVNSGKADGHGKDFMKTKFDKDDGLLLNIPFKFLTMTIVVRSVFEGDGKFCPQIYLCLHGK